MAFYERYLAAALPLIARRLSGNAEAYNYLAELIAAWPAQPELARRIGAAGWRAVRWRNLTMGVVAVRHQDVFNCSFCVNRPFSSRVSSNVTSRWTGRFAGENWRSVKGWALVQSYGR